MEQVSKEIVNELANSPIVLVSYSVLAQEVNYKSDFSDKYSFRGQKKYPIIDSPITLVDWHRVVYDEAQMVGIGLTAIAQMAKRIHGEYKWCVSGTPIGPNQLQDLKGLFSVLDHEPFDGPVFDSLVKAPI